MSNLNNEPRLRQAHRALKLFTTDPMLKAWLERIDPKALEQVTKAIAGLEELGSWPQLDPDAPAVPLGLQPRHGVEMGCGEPSCADCYEPIDR